MKRKKEKKKRRRKKAGGRGGGGGVAPKSCTFCVGPIPKKIAYFSTSCVFGPCSRTLAVNLVSNTFERTQCCTVCDRAIWQYTHFPKPFDRLVSHWCGNRVGFFPNACLIGVLLDGMCLR